MECSLISAQHCVAGGFWDFTSDLSLKDTAYTSLALGAHTDTTYFTDPAGLQMFHLLSHTAGEGGSSLLVDGFAAAKELALTFPKAFDILSTFRLYSHASGNQGINMRSYVPYPVLNTHRTGRYVYQVRWNNDDRAVLKPDMPGGHSVEDWYDAARKWVEILKSPRREYWEQLRPGKPLSMSPV